MFEIDWQIFFANLLLPYKPDLFWLKLEKYEKPQVNFKTPLFQKFKNVIFHLFTTYLNAIK
jgi:hypothetical protein